GVLPNTATVEMQLWIGNGGGSCYGGSTSPIICDNPATHYLQEDETYYLPGRMLDLSVPFEFWCTRRRPGSATTAMPTILGSGYSSSRAFRRFANLPTMQI